jgi:hypothetical protein
LKSQESNREKFKIQILYLQSFARSFLQSDPLGKGLLYDNWKRACRSLEIDGVDLYGGTRHSSAQALREHMSRENVRELTGHHTSAAFNRYFWADVQALREGYQKMRK